MFDCFIVLLFCYSFIRLLFYCFIDKFKIEYQIPYIASRIDIKTSNNLDINDNNFNNILIENRIIKEFKLNSNNQQRYIKVILYPSIGINQSFVAIKQIKFYSDDIRY